MFKKTKIISFALICLYNKYSCKMNIKIKLMLLMLLN